MNRFLIIPLIAFIFISCQESETAEPLTPTITIQALKKVVGEPPFDLEATSNSPGMLSFSSSNLTVATVQGKTVTILSPGETTITVSQEAAGGFVAGNASVVLVVEGIQPTISNISNIERNLSEPNFTIQIPNSNSPGTFRFTSSDPDVATIEDAVVTVVGAGTTEISVIQAASGNFASASVSCKLTVFPEVSTLAGSGVLGAMDGPATGAAFWSPNSVTVDMDGNVFVAEPANQRIRKITPEGIVSTIAGGGAPGIGNKGSADGPGPQATFLYPTAICLDGTGNLYIADSENNKIRKLDKNGTVSTFAGSGQQGSTDGKVESATFNVPIAVAIDGSGNVLVAEAGNNKIRKITPNGLVSTVAGNGEAGSKDGTGIHATFNYPNGLAVDSSGNIFVADYKSHKIRKISSSGVVTTVAGSGEPGFTNGTGVNASFNGPYSVATDKHGNVYAADHNNHSIRKINKDGVVTTLVGTGKAGARDGSDGSVSFSAPAGIVVSGNKIYVADNLNNKIRLIKNR